MSAIMEGGTEMTMVVQNQGIEAEYILYILKNLSRHISIVEERLEILQQVFSENDFEHLFTSVSSLRKFLDDIIVQARIYKHPPSSSV